MKFRCVVKRSIFSLLQPNGVHLLARELNAWNVVTKSVCLAHLCVGTKCFFATERASLYIWWTQPANALNAKPKFSSICWAIDLAPLELTTPLSTSAAWNASPNTIVTWRKILTKTFSIFSEKVNQTPPQSTLQSLVTKIVLYFQLRFVARCSVRYMPKTFRLRFERCDYRAWKWYYSILLLEHVHDGRLHILRRSESQNKHVRNPRSSWRHQIGLFAEMLDSAWWAEINRKRWLECSRPADWAFATIDSDGQSNWIHHLCGDLP